MAQEGGQKMQQAVEAAMKKFNIKPPGPPPGMGNGMGGPPMNGNGGQMPQMPGMPQMSQQSSSQGSGAKRSSSPYKQRRF